MSVECDVDPDNGARPGHGAEARGAGTRRASCCVRQPAGHRALDAITGRASSSRPTKFKCSSKRVSHGRSNSSSSSRSTIRTTPPKSSRGKQPPPRLTASGSLLKLNALFMFNALHRRARDTLRAVVLFVSCLLVVADVRGRGARCRRFSRSCGRVQVQRHRAARRSCRSLQDCGRLLHVSGAFRVRDPQRHGDDRRSAVAGRPRQVRSDVRQKRRNLSQRVDDPHSGETGGGSVRSGGHVPRLRGRGHLLSANGARVPRGRRRTARRQRECRCGGRRTGGTERRSRSALVVRTHDQRRLCAVAPARRQLLRDHRSFLRRGRGAESAAVLVSDDPDPVGDHHRRRGARDAWAGLCAVARLCDRDGAGLHGAWRSRRHWSGKALARGCRIRGCSARSACC